MNTVSTDLRPTHLSAGIFFKIENEKLHVLLIGYQYRGQLQVKFPAGTNAEYAHDNPVATLKREMLQEAGLEPLTGSEIESCRRHFPPDPLRQKGEHTKHFIIITDYGGELRTGDFKDGEEILKPPQWVEYRSALQQIFHSHREALEALPAELLKLVGGKDRETFDALDTAVHELKKYRATAARTRR